MSDRTWRETRFAPCDRAAVEGALGMGETDVGSGSDFLDLHYVSEVVPDPDDYKPLVDAGIPFVGTHGAYAGSYDACTFAFDGKDYAEVTANEDGFPVVRFGKTGTEPSECAEAAAFWLVHERAIVAIGRRDG